jgi:hypothetical protein
MFVRGALLSAVTLALDCRVASAPRNDEVEGAGAGVRSIASGFG